MRLILILILTSLLYPIKYYGSADFYQMLSTNESSKETKRLGYGAGFSFVYNDLFYKKLNSGVSIS